MTGTGTLDNPKVIENYDDFIEFLTEFHLDETTTATFNELHPMYYALNSNLDFRKNVYQNKDVAIHKDIPTSYDATLLYSKVLNMNGHTISNFFMNNCRIWSEKRNTKTYRIAGGVIDSWILKNTNFQGLNHLESVLEFNECSISMCMIGENKMTVHPNHIRQLNKPTNSDIGEITNNSYYATFVSPNNICGNYIKFVKCTVTLQYYPNKYYFNLFKDSHSSNNHESCYANMMQLMRFDNTEAEISVSRPPAPFVGMHNDASKNDSEVWTHFGISVTNFSNIIIKTKCLPCCTQYSIQKSSGGSSVGTISIMSPLFYQLSDSVVQIYPDGFYIYGSSVMGFTTPDETHTNSLYSYGKVSFNVVGGTSTTGTSVLYVDTSKVSSDEVNWTGIQGYTNYSNVESKNIVYSLNKSDLSNAEWLIDNGIVCLDKTVEE